MSLVLSVAQLILENHVIYIIFLCKCVAFTIVEHTPSALLHCLYSSRNFGKPRHLHYYSRSMRGFYYSCTYSNCTFALCMHKKFWKTTSFSIICCTINFWKPRHLVLSIAQLILENHVISIIFYFFESLVDIPSKKKKCVFVFSFSFFLPTYLLFDSQLCPVC